MSEPFINIERAGHRITLDSREGFTRVNCNGATYAKFNEPALGELVALKHAVAFAEELEAKCIEFPKEKP